MTILRRWSSIDNSQNGLGLIELLVGIAITSLISGVLVMSIIQTDRTVSKNRNHVASVSRVHNAGHWIHTDAQMAQTVEVDDDESGLPLILAWTDWDNEHHQITYAIEEGDLTRSHVIVDGAANKNLVAQSVNISPEMTNCAFSSGVLTFKLTVTEGEGPRASSETRVFEVVPRAT
ncbi:MAG: hypothetical protein HOC20_08215 [Chloroflexi bacterium]|jgi:hypothetical protein|nr:hypothetical protein [Chloroflexota bacterium]